MTVGGSDSTKDTCKKFGWLWLGIGADGYVSTSKVQVMLWTLGMAFVLSYLGFLVAFGAHLG